MANKLVVNLSEFQQCYQEVEEIRNTIEFMGHIFDLDIEDGYYVLSSAGYKYVIDEDLEVIRQWICEHFDRIFKKDMPNVDVTFRWD